MVSKRIEGALGAFVRSKQKGMDSGNYTVCRKSLCTGGQIVHKNFSLTVYQRNARRAIEEWIDWLADRETWFSSAAFADSTP